MAFAGRMHIYRVGQKDVPLYFCPYLRQLLTNFQNSFTGTLYRHKCVSTLPCEILTKYAYITIITNKRFCKIKKKHFQPTLQSALCYTKLCASNESFTAMLLWSAFSFI